MFTLYLYIYIYITLCIYICIPISNGVESPLIGAYTTIDSLTSTLYNLINKFTLTNRRSYSYIYTHMCINTLANVYLILNSSFAFIRILVSPILREHFL